MNQSSTELFDFRESLKLLWLEEYERERIQHQTLPDGKFHKLVGLSSLLLTLVNLIIYVYIDFTSFRTSHCNPGDCLWEFFEVNEVAEENSIISDGEKPKNLVQFSKFCIKCDQNLFDSYLLPQEQKASRSSVLSFLIFTLIANLALHLTNMFGVFFYQLWILYLFHLVTWIKISAWIAFKIWSKDGWTRSNKNGKFIY